MLLRLLIIALGLLFIFPELFASEGFDDFRLYQKPLLKWVEIAQTETHTELLYNRVVIKTYVNAEFPTELLTHSPDEDPDCYNSLQSQAPSTRAKNIIGKDYLRSCLVLQTRLIRGRYILFYGPAVDGNRVSIYDIRTKKFYHGIVNNVLDVKTTIDGGLLFLKENVGFTCQKSILLYKDGATRTIFDECSLQNIGYSSIRIDSYRLVRQNLVINYTPYIEHASGDILLDRSRREQKMIQL